MNTERDSRTLSENQWQEAPPQLRLVAGLMVFMAMALSVLGPFAIAQQADQATSQADESPFGDLLEGLQESGDAARKATAEDATADDVAETARNKQPAASDLATSPLLAAQRAMGEAARLLAEDQLSAPTQSAQQRALDALDAFVEQSLAASAGTASADPQASQPQAGEQQRQPDASSQQGEALNQGDRRQGDRPGRQTDAAAKQPGQAPEQAIEEVTSPLLQPLEQAVWGHLPERMRERLQATLPEEFLPAYEQAIRDYFTRLSEMSDADGS